MGLVNIAGVTGGKMGYYNSSKHLKSDESSLPWGNSGQMFRGTLLAH